MEDIKKIYEILNIVSYYFDLYIAFYHQYTILQNKIIEI